MAKFWSYHGQSGQTTSANLEGGIWSNFYSLFVLDFRMAKFLSYHGQS